MRLGTRPDIENVNNASRYFMSKQADYVEDESNLMATVKANRIGWTWTDAYRNVRLRLMHAKRDYLLTTQNWNGALEYGRYVEEWLRVYDLGRFILSRNEQTITVHEPQPDGSKVAVQVKVGIYTFDNGSRIILFPSSPWAMQTFEGDVGWDEAAFHQHQEQMWAAIATRLLWGFNASVWSAHNGVGSWFNQVLLKQAMAPGSKWKFRKIDIYDAIKDGIVEKINQKTGRNQTREEFLADCKVRALTAAIFAERYECAPCDSGTNITPWSVIEAACTREIIRAHVGDAEVKQLFGLPGSFDTEAKIKARMAKMGAWMAGRFGQLLESPEHLRLGYDVAASGKGDLGSMWLSAKVGTRLLQRALLTTQTPDWNFHRAALWWFMELPAIKGCGDGTGLGREITWSAAQRFNGRFEGINFTRDNKAAMGARVMNMLTAGEFEMASADARTGHPDIGMDYYSLQKHTDGGALVFSESQNPLNAASHCDIAWSGNLAAHADATVVGGGGPFGFTAMSSGGGGGPFGGSSFKDMMASLRRRVWG